KTINIWNVETGECIQTLRGHERRVWGIALSPDGKTLASGSSDQTIRLWNTQTGEPKEIIPIQAEICLTMAWSQDGKILASAGVRDDWSIMIWNVENRTKKIVEGHRGYIYGLKWSPDGQQLASASHDNTIRLWDKDTGKITNILNGHFSDVYSVCWSPDGEMLASGSSDNTIRIWNINTGQTLFVLEGHTGSVNCVEFSFDGKLLASKSSDGTVRLWRCDTWKTVAILQESTHKSLPFGLAFHPTKNILATLGEADTVTRIWQIDEKAIFNAPPVNLSAEYTNAKVILVGESGVGKSGLSLVLNGEEFAPTESTHARHVWTFDKQKVELENGRQEMREVLLWDLAGQPSYRLVHQLHLNELAVALIVFDARSETDPFGGVHYWNRALRQAENFGHDSRKKIKKFLVSSRVDRGKISVSPNRIQSLVKELGFDGYFETSAKEGWGIEELAQAIKESINWDYLPKVISTELFQKIKTFLIKEKQAQRLLSRIEDLYLSFLQSQQVLSDSKELKEQFKTCVKLVESRDLIRRLSFGNFVLLQPERLDAYASAIIDAAKDEPEGFGCIAEEDVLEGRFRMSQEERLQDKEQEKLLLIATIEELFSREIALRPQTDSGTLLVFPSQFTREYPQAPDPEGKTIIFEFEGAILNVYTTLTVRLSRSGWFKRKEMWKNAALFSAWAGGECGIWLRQVEEGKAQLTLFFEEASNETRSLFEEYVHTHLKRKASPQSISFRRIFVCSECDTPVSELQVKRRKERGFEWINCSVCDTKVWLTDSGEECSDIDENETSKVPEMDKFADYECQKETAVSILKGKEETKDFDVFLAHNSKDKSEIEKIAESLKNQGLNPWLDKEQIPPGSWFQEVIQQAIGQVKSAAICIGPNGLGRWQQIELRTFTSRCLEAKIPVIPVMLPGIKEIPSEYFFLRELNGVFFDSIDDDKALDNLIWGITGRRP
ncbi:MAG: TIR domain-containing protein, partial [Cyanobacteriota bacterium]|nr:TIR domain-containing protein [Cyanobacteriota bacterium]